MKLVVWKTFVNQIIDKSDMLLQENFIALKIYLCKTNKLSKLTVSLLKSVILFHGVLVVQNGI